MNAPLRWIGREVPQLDGPEKVSGRALYAGDIYLEGLLQAAVLRSPHQHARIVAIDISAAKSAPGVRAVITGADCPRQYINFGPAYADRYPLAVDRVRFIGEEVVAVAADTLAQAQAALALIDVHYELLPAAATVNQALDNNAPEVHQRQGLARNVAQHTEAKFGAVDEGFEQADFVIDGVFEHGVTVPVCMETNSVVAQFDTAAADLTVWAPTQAPFFVRKELAHVMELSPERVHVRSVTIGGGFGGKSQSPEPIAVAALLARASGKPVRLVLSRKDEFLSGKTDHGKRMRVRTAVSADGSLLARQTTYTVDNGAYTHMGPAYISAVRQRTCNLYRVAAAGFEGRLVYTNKVPGGSYRGMGAPQIIWAIETQIDQIAERLGRDRLDYRIQVANRAGDETPQGWRLGTCGLVECLEELGRRIDWPSRRERREPWRGIGFAAMINPSVGVLYPEGNFAHVSIDLEPGGTLLVGTQTADAGTGQNTVLAQFVAEELQLPLEQVHVLHMDTDRTPADLGSAASRVTFVTGAAALTAAREFRKSALGRCAAMLNTSEEQLSWRAGEIATSDGRVVTLAELAARAPGLRVVGRHDIDLPRADPKTGYGHYAPAYGFGAQAIEVEVNPHTGHVRVLRVVSVQDVGRVINRLALDGQMHGGIVQGIGMALREEAVFDHGAPVNTSMINYRVPRAAETPIIETYYVETLDPSGPLGAKAGGEHSINPVPAAIANALYDAIGVRFHRLPITPAMVLEAIASQPHRPHVEPPAPQSWRRPFNLEVAAVRSLYPKGLFPAMKALGRAVGKRKSGREQFDWLRPRSVDEALEMLADSTRRVRVMGGGTDLRVGLRQAVYQADACVDVSGLADLRSIRIEKTHDGSMARATLGAAVTLSEVLAHGELMSCYPSLQEGLLRLATPQIRNMATLAGDLCQEKRCWFFRSGAQCYKNGGAGCPCYAVTGDSRHHAILGARRCAAPCVADCAPILHALDARVIVSSTAGERAVGLDTFYRWSGEPAIEPSELITRIEVPIVADSSDAFEKYAQWTGDFAEASAAVCLRWQQGAIAQARVALGGVSPLPIRVEQVERALVGKPPNAARLTEIARTAVYGALPLADNRWKLGLLAGVVERALTRAIDRHAGRPAVAKFVEFQ